MSTVATEVVSILFSPSKWLSQERYWTHLCFGPVRKLVIISISPTGERLRRCWFASSLCFAPHSRHVAEVFDVVRVVPKEPNQDDLRDAVLGLFDQSLLQFDFSLLDLGEVDQHWSSRLRLPIHISLLPDLGRERLASV